MDISLHNHIQPFSKMNPTFSPLCPSNILQDIEPADNAVIVYRIALNLNTPELYELRNWLSRFQPVHDSELYQAHDCDVIRKVMPPRYVHSPLWAATLPRPLHGKGASMVSNFPETLNLTTANLLHNETYHVMHDNAARETGAKFEGFPGHGIVFGAWATEDTFDKVLELGLLTILLIDGETAHLTIFRVDTDWLACGLHGQYAGTGWGYRPYAHHDEEEILAVADKGYGGDRFVGSDLPPGLFSCAVFKTVEADCEPSSALVSLFPWAA